MARRPQRYLLVKFLSKSTISSAAAEQTVRRSIDEMFGKLGSTDLRMRMISFSEQDGKAVLRCSRDSVERLRAVLALIARVNGNPVATIVLRSSGTIKALGMRAQRYGK